MGLHQEQEFVKFGPSEEFIVQSAGLNCVQQSEDRAHRIGQKNNVTYVDLIAEKTVDEKIVKSLQKKINIAAKVLGEDIREWLT